MRVTGVCVSDCGMTGAMKRLIRAARKGGRKGRKAAKEAAAIAKAEQQGYRRALADGRLGPRLFSKGGVQG